MIVTWGESCNTHNKTFAHLTLWNIWQVCIQNAENILLMSFFLCNILQVSIPSFPWNFLIWVLTFKVINHLGLPARWAYIINICVSRKKVEVIYLWVFFSFTNLKQQNGREDWRSTQFLLKTRVLFFTVFCSY